MPFYHSAYHGWLLIGISSLCRDEDQRTDLSDGSNTCRFVISDNTINKMFTATSVSIVGIFENRYHVLSANPFWKKVRYFWYSVNFIQATVYFLPVYYRIPEEQEKEREFVITVSVTDILSSLIKSSHVFQKKFITLSINLTGRAQLPGISDFIKSQFHVHTLYWITDEIRW